AKQLIEKGEAYYCFCTKEELERRIGNDEANGGVSRYDGLCRELAPEEIKRRLAAGDPYIIRQKMPKSGTTRFVDLVYGEIEVDNAELEDQILIKSDGMPTYNFANVIDDHAMEITHVVRGNEYLSSAPKYNLLYEAFGWEVPQYIHCAPVMKNEHEKLSKRNGDASYQDLVAKGYLPAAIINYLALLGWSPKGEQEIFSLSDLAREFSVDGISKSPAIFDGEKLKYINGEYIRALSPEEYKEYALPYIKQAVKSDIDVDTLCAAMQPRTETFADIPEKLGFIDTQPEFSSELYFNKKMKTDVDTARPALEAALPVLESLESWTQESIHESLFALIEKMEVKNGWLLWPLRVALSGVAVSPGGGVELAKILGRDESIARIKKALARL
ncbi:MAG: glutamate--tRNA ligase, partial [Oscillospiraceae bacterium]